MLQTTPAFAIALTTPTYFGLHVSSREAHAVLAGMTSDQEAVQGAIMEGLRSRGTLLEKATGMVERAVGGAFDIRQTEIPVDVLRSEGPGPLLCRGTCGLPATLCCNPHRCHKSEQ